MFEKFFPNPLKVVGLEKENETLKDEIKSLKREREDTNYRTERNLSRLQESHEDTLEGVRTESSRKVSEAEYRATQAEKERDEVKEEYSDKIERVSKDIKKTARLEAREDVQEEIDELKVELTNALSVANAESSRAEETSKVVEELKGLVKDYREFVQFAMTKLPEVDLKKFNINVDVPPAEVTVKNEVAQGGKKK